MGDSYKFDVRAFVSAIGGPAKVVANLAEMGLAVEECTVRQWITRGTLGIIYVVNLLVHAELNGKPTPFLSYVTRELRPGGPRRPRSGAAV